MRPGRIDALDAPAQVDLERVRMRVHAGRHEQHAFEALALAVAGRANRDDPPVLDLDREPRAHLAARQHRELRDENAHPIIGRSSPVSRAVRSAIS